MGYKDLTIEQKIGRVLCARPIRGRDADMEYTLKLLRSGACSVVQVRVNKDAPEVIKTLREAADYPIIIVNDMEKGYLPSGRPTVPMLSLAACNNPEYTRAFAAVLAKEAREDGFSGCWGPVVDILHCNAPCSVFRKAGDTPEGVLKLTRDIAEVFSSYNFQATAKHYPGGFYDIDTHMAEGTCSATEEDLLKFDLVPYLELIKDGILPAIMTEHSSFPNIDPDYPASLSKKVIDIIRNQGYDGLLYTDSLAMMGILQKYGEKRAMALALMAGNDVILPNYRTSTEDVYKMMLECYEEGLITEERIDEANRRIEEAAAKFAAIPENPEKVPENINDILLAISRDCITAEYEDGISRSLSPEEKMLFIVSTPMEFSELNEEVSFGKWYSPHRVKSAILESFPNSEVEFIPEFPTGSDNERILNAATLYDKVVFVTYCTTEAYLGTDGLTRRLEEVIKCLNLSGKIEALVHFGNPMAILTLPTIPRRILGYLASDSQKYAFEVLSGKIEAKGKNPFPRLCKG